MPVGKGYSPPSSRSHGYSYRTTALPRFLRWSTTEQLPNRLGQLPLANLNAPCQGLKGWAIILHDLLISPPKNKNQMPTNQTIDAFLDYNAGKLEVRNGLVHLLAAGWAEYAPSFSKAGILLRDDMPVDEFKQALRTANRAAIQDNDRALREHLADLTTPVEEKQLIRAVLSPQPKAQAPAQQAQVLQFPARGKKPIGT